VHCGKGQHELLQKRKAYNCEEVSETKLETSQIVRQSLPVHVWSLRALLLKEILSINHLVFSDCIN